MSSRLRRWGFVGVMAGFCAVFVLLCHWQIERLAWKQAILERFDQIETAADKTPLDLSLVSAISPTNPVAGSLTGVVDLCHAQFVVNKVQNDLVGKHMLAPLTVASGDIMVDFGWVAADTLLPVCAKNTQRITVYGVATMPHWNSFMPVGEVSPGHWARADVVSMALGQKRKLAAPILFLALEYPLSTGVISPIPPTLENMRPRNSHLQYAIFWGVMATLIAIMTLIYLRPKDRF